MDKTIIITGIVCVSVLTGVAMLNGMEQLAGVGLGGIVGVLAPEGVRSLTSSNDTSVE